MDSTGKIYLVVSLPIIILSLITFWYLSKKMPKGSILAICAVIYMLGYSIDPGNQRALYILKGTMQMIGSLGAILGIIDLFRKKKSQL